MFGYYTSLSGFERSLLLLGILSLSIALINILVEMLELIDRGVRKRKTGRTAMLLATSSICVFSFLTLIMISKKISWYIAYPVSVLAALVYCFLGVVFLGITRRVAPLGISPPKKDKRVAIGHTGLVYKTVLPDEATGCVSVDVFGSTIEAYAISATGDSIPIGTIVKIIDIDDEILVCSDRSG